MIRRQRFPHAPAHLPVSPMCLFLLIGLLSTGSELSAQEAPDGFREAFMRQFNYSARRLNALAEAIPGESYAWSPGEGVMSIERVYMHISRYNYLYLSAGFGAELPVDVDLETIEQLTGKETAAAHLETSLEYVRSIVESLPDEALSGDATLYGRTVPGWQVLLQLISHMNEHVGQSIAYARMNGVVPPWSR